MATQDLQRRTGGTSIIIAGRQSKYGKPITTAELQKDVKAKYATISDTDLAKVGVFNGANKAPGQHINFDGDAITEDPIPDWRDPAHIIAGLSAKRYPFTRNTVDPTAETAESESITGDNAAVPDIIISRSGGGDLELEVLPGDAINLLQGWFNAPTPTRTEIKSFGADNLVATGNIKLDGNKVRFDGDGDWTDNTREGLSPAWPGQIKIKGAVGLTGSGRIVINGVQRRSRSNKFNAQTIETIEVASSGDRTKLNGSGGDDGLFSTKFFNDIYEIDFLGFGGTLTKPTVEILPDTQKASLELPAITSLFPGWSLQMIKAALPYIAFDVIPNLFRLTVNQGSMRLLLTVLASYVQEGRTLEDPIQIVHTFPEANSESPARKILDVYGYNTTDFYPSYGTALAIGDPGEELASLRTKVENGTAHITPITQVEIIGNHNYGNPDGFTGDPIGGQPVTEDGQTRTVNVNATVVHETDTSGNAPNATAFWQDRYFEGQEVPIIIHNYNWNGLGRQTRIESEFAKCRLGEVPGLPIEGTGQVNRSLAFEAFPKGPDKEIKMNFYSKDGWAE